MTFFCNDNMTQNIIYTQELKHAYIYCINIPHIKNMCVKSVHHTPMAVTVLVHSNNKHKSESTHVYKMNNLCQKRLHTHTNTHTWVRYMGHNFSGVQKTLDRSPRNETKSRHDVQCVVNKLLFLHLSLLVFLFYSTSKNTIWNACYALCPERAVIEDTTLVHNTGFTQVWLIKIQTFYRPDWNISMPKWTLHSISRISCNRRDLEMSAHRWLMHDRCTIGFQHPHFFLTFFFFFNRNMLRYNFIHWSFKNTRVLISKNVILFPDHYRVSPFFRTFSRPGKGPSKFQNVFRLLKLCEPWTPNQPRRLHQGDFLKEEGQ